LAPPAALKTRESAVEAAESVIAVFKPPAVLNVTMLVPVGTPALQLPAVPQVPELVPIQLSVAPCAATPMMKGIRRRPRRRGNVDWERFIYLGCNTHS
jgi:hypothetical protein